MSAFNCIHKGLHSIMRNSPSNISLSPIVLFLRRERDSLSVDFELLHCFLLMKVLYDLTDFMSENGVPMTLEVVDSAEKRFFK